MRLLLAFVLLACACGPNRRTVRTWIERDMECTDVEITHVTFHYFEAEGCEERWVYHCPGRETCERSTSERSSGAETGGALDPPG